MSTTMKPLKSVCLFPWHAKRMLVWTWVDLILRLKLLLDLFPGCEFFIFPYLSSCYWQTPEHVLQTAWALGWRVLKCISNCTEYIPVWSGSATKARGEDKAALYTPWVYHLGRSLHKSFVLTGYFSALSVLHPLEECPRISLFPAALHLVSAWDPSNSLPFKTSRWWKSMHCWGTPLYLLYFSAGKVPLDISWNLSFLPGAWWRGSQKGWGSGSKYLV